MKQLKCEMCGSTDFVKEDGFFVCQSCGLKYSPEEAKKVMVEGKVEVEGKVDVQGSVKIDSSEKDKHLLTLAETAVDAFDFDGAAKNLDKYLDNNPGDGKVTNELGLINLLFVDPSDNINSKACTYEAAAKSALALVKQQTGDNDDEACAIYDAMLDDCYKYWRIFSKLKQYDVVYKTAKELYFRIITHVDIQLDYPDSDSPKYKDLHRKYLAIVTAVYSYVEPSQACAYLGCDTEAINGITEKYTEFAKKLVTLDPTLLSDESQSVTINDFYTVFNKEIFYDNLVKLVANDQNAYSAENLQSCFELLGNYKDSAKQLEAIKKYANLSGSFEVKYHVVYLSLNKVESNTATFSLKNNLITIRCSDKTDNTGSYEKSFAVKDVASVSLQKSYADYKMLMIQTKDGKEYTSVNVGKENLPPMLAAKECFENALIAVNGSAKMMETELTGKRREDKHKGRLMGVLSIIGLLVDIFLTIFLIKDGMSILGSILIGFASFFGVLLVGSIIGGFVIGHIVVSASEKNKKDSDK